MVRILARVLELNASWYQILLHFPLNTSLKAKNSGDIFLFGLCLSRRRISPIARV